MIQKDRRALQALAKALRFRPHAGQVKVLEAFCENRFLCLVCGRRWGKTLLVSLLAAYVMLHRDGKVLAMSKTYKLAFKMWRYLARDIKRLLGQNVKINNSEMTMTTPWGAVLELGTAENPDSLLGDGYDLVIADEAATLKEVIFEQNLSPAIRDRKGSIVLISTPRGFNWVFNKFRLGQSREAGWWSYTGPSNENVHVWDKEEWELAKRQSDPIYFRQEYLAEFVVFADQVYCDFTEERNVITTLPDLTGWDHYFVVDPGYRTAALLWCAYNRVSDELIFYKECIGPRLRNEDILKQIRQNEPECGYKALLSDIAGHARTGDAGYSMISYLNEQEWMMERGLFITVHKQGITTGINLVKSRILNANMETRVKYLSQGCPELIRMHYNLMYEEGKEVYVKDGVHDHPADAERYIIYHLDRALGRGGVNIAV